MHTAATSPALICAVCSARDHSMDGILLLVISLPPVQLYNTDFTLSSLDQSALSDAPEPMVSGMRNLELRL